MMSADSWPFDQPRDCATFTTRQVLEREESITGARLSALALCRHISASLPNVICGGTTKFVADSASCYDATEIET